MARRRRLGVRLLIGVAVLAVVGTAGGIAYARSGSAPGYRTATVTRGSVTAELDLVGTATAAQDATVGFAQGGTVASVGVALGQKVTAGQTLATLDLTTLNASLTQAQASEAGDAQTLAEAENGQLPASTGGSRGSSTGSGSGGSGAAVATSQKKVVSAQSGVDAARATVTTALAAATAVCPAPTAHGTSHSRSSGGTTSTSSCLAAESSLLGAQENLASRQMSLSSAQSALSRELNSSGSTASSGTSGVSAVQLAAYQAAVDADTAAVTVAQQNVNQGTAVSPLSGTVVAVGLTAGQTVSAASSTDVIEVSAPNSYRVATVVPMGSITQVAVGQHASVTPDGGSTALPATVTAIAPVPTSTGYPVTLGLTGAATGLRQGASASVRLTTGTSSTGIVVPTSAVHSFGSRHLVEVLSGKTVAPTVVTIGTMSAQRTVILTGLKVGQQVVLADLSSTVTSDSSTTTGGGGGFGGRPVGAGGGAGGGAGAGAGAGAGGAAGGGGTRTGG